VLLFYIENHIRGLQMRNRYELPTKVLIAGKWWGLKPFSKKEDMDTAKGGDGEVQYGRCYHHKKQIHYRGGQHPEELLDTLVHEGIHAILGERSGKFGSMYGDESVIDLLTSDFMTYLKQIAEVQLK
jgi:hypothetical protein